MLQKITQGGIEMKKVTLLLLAVLLMAVPSFAEKMQTVVGQGRYVSHTLSKLPAFNAVEVRGDAEVDFMQHANASVTVSGRENLVDLSDVRVENGVLVVGFKRPVHIRGEHHLRVAVSAPELNTVSVSQGGEFDVRGSLKTSSLSLSAVQDSEISMDYVQADAVTLSAAGRSEVELNRVQAGRINASAADRADVDLSGQVEEVTLVNDGSGEIDADDLRAVQAHATTNASGKIKVYATDALYAQANARGKIEYKGYPSTVRREGNAKKIVRDREHDYED